jgi:hypothetical protein
MEARLAEHPADRLQVQHGARRPRAEVVALGRAQVVQHLAHRREAQAGHRLAVGKQQEGAQLAALGRRQQLGRLDRPAEERAAAAQPGQVADELAHLGRLTVFAQVEGLPAVLEEAGLVAGVGLAGLGRIAPSRKSS